MTVTGWFVYTFIAYIGLIYAWSIRNIIAVLAWAVVASIGIMQLMNLCLRSE